MVRINGKDAPDVVSLSVLEYLKQSSYKLQHVVVELNEEILPKEAYGKTILNDGDVLEILSFMGGGSGA
ncbi:sulfur carrier protein ThiS [Roseburia sp. MUC/MUC-530-WT-4D]|uniref:Sulfur carrier protein ThiS n=1 Tax=Roseburia porci TaxID=2605790 RepID=A0A6L5YN17_9FIRM|nr:sulfur carrier protein ThiS [Roseburia porci]MST73790.1 sulfur carrier protein ThiS [Roseburia porci]